MENSLSEPYKLCAGVRQGGVLSPVLFSVYVDDLLNKFKRHGCHLRGLSVSALIYADDLILISPSVTELQAMLDLCGSELASIDIKLNSKNSNAVRIGNRFKIDCVKLHV